MERRGPRSGTWLVVGMFGFGLLLTAGLYAYWTLHTAPFRPLRDALAAKYPGSAPRVEGGKPRLDRPGERVLRIIMKSPFDPPDAFRAESFAHEVATFAASRQPLNEFDVVEVHLFREHPEQQLSQRTVRLKVGEITPTSR